MANSIQKQLQFLMYSTPGEDVKVNALVKDETIWLTQKAMGELFGCSSDNVGLHLKNVYEDGELSKDSTTEEISVVQQEGARSVKRKIAFYNLDAIISMRPSRTSSTLQLLGRFNYVEDLIEREIPFTMQQFAGAVNEFLEFRKYQVLDGKGKISHEQAERKAFAEYDVFNKTQKIESDFDKLVKKTKRPLKRGAFG